ncbi:sugar transferase [Streptomyces sp. NPDC050504]|uniref:sugar transferase n=1 Tax=Streptomyces sp. NPDC050504 TaxID=3365618 RepID=UPI00378D9BEC
MSTKRLLDLVGTLLLLLLTAPLLVAAATAVAATSPGGVLTRQPRAGRDGHPFQLLRFRTARTDGGRRVTPVGRFLRRHSIDELPQLLHVLRGEMSLVGPRPLPAGHAACTGAARARLSVRPGVTGLWQVRDRSEPELPWNEMALLDLHYVDHHWIGLDLRILARTVPVVLGSRRTG